MQEALLCNVPVAMSTIYVCNDYCKTCYYLPDLLYHASTDWFRISSGCGRFI